MTLQWVSAGLVDGRLIASLPGVEIDDGSPMRKTISTYDTITGSLQLTPDPADPTRAQPQNWERALEEGASFLACFDDTDPHRSIQWDGWVSVQVRDGNSDSVAFTLATLEAYLDRRCVGDVTYDTTWGRNAIIADLVNNWILAEGPTIALELDYTGAGPKPAEPLVWQNTDNKSVLNRITQLIGQLGGEFTIDCRWSSDGLSLVHTLHFGDKLGTPAPAGLDPAVTVEMPGVITEFTETRDYSSSKGANKIVPYSSGQGGDTPYGTPVLAPDFKGRPIFEERYQPAPSISPVALQQYARQAIAIRAPGARTITLTWSTARSDGRRLGSDFHMGDDIGYRIGASDADGRPVLAFPGGVSGVGRMIAYERTKTTITAILAQTDVYTDPGTG